MYAIWDTKSRTVDFPSIATTNISDNGNTDRFSDMEQLAFLSKVDYLPFKRAANFCSLFPCVLAINVICQLLQKILHAAAAAAARRTRQKQ